MGFDLKVIAPLIALQLILLIVALVDLIRRESDRVKGPKWVWTLIVIFIGTFGPIIYFLVGRKD